MMNNSKHIIFILFLLISSGISHAQMEKVYLDYSARTFEGNMPLPAEQKFMVEGDASPTTTMVLLEIHRNLESDRRPVFRDFWMRGQDVDADRFSILIHQKLRGSEEYDFVFRFYRDVRESELDYIQQQLRSQVEIYLVNRLEEGGKEYRWSESTARLKEELDNIINDALSSFLSRDGKTFDGLSDNVKVSIDALGDRQIQEEEAADEESAGTFDKRPVLQSLVDQIVNETKQYTHQDLYYAFDERQVKRYSTEMVRNTVAINIGYGGVWFDGGFNDFNYDHSPYAGISVPFGKEAFAKPFWNNLSFSAGVFLLNFQDGEGNTVTGPVIQRPFYFGLGYKFFKFLKLQAGATLLETKVEDAGFVEFDEISIRPFIGISAEFDFWMDFAK